MTYCVAINVEEGLVLLSDTRTNAGVDNISRFRKMFTWEVPGERVLVLMTAGSLSITQGVISRLQSAIDRAAAGEAVNTILDTPTLFESADMVGKLMRETQEENRAAMTAQGVNTGASIILAGQRKGGRPRIFLIYAAGNFIEATRDTPFLQIGEHKYGKPILDRVIVPEIPLEEALKAALVSMDSTLRSNLSVGMPLDLAIIGRDEYCLRSRRRIENGDRDFAALSASWSDALRHAFVDLPDYPA